ncbi:putative glycerophosphoinositol permease [Lyophyllum shimeji]|uniref:Glycerophosphoinositol permease n=1 Tax=Lyophyllum shimeji TaxID=47721 RepID=A0A9P3UMF0_LYOSH|nr:putative glycerophosphoinositol permease [Lyophyllum shimeji]
MAIANSTLVTSVTHMLFNTNLRYRSSNKPACLDHSEMGPSRKFSSGSMTGAPQAATAGKYIISARGVLEDVKFTILTTGMSLDVAPQPKTPSMAQVDELIKEQCTTEALGPKERLSGFFSILAAAFGLINDGYQNNLMTMANVVFNTLYPTAYTPVVSTRVSNALLVRLSVKPAALFWFLTFARGITETGVGGGYAAASASSSEAANQESTKSRGPVFIMVTNLFLSSGGPLSVSVFLLAAGSHHLQTV